MEFRLVLDGQRSQLRIVGQVTGRAQPAQKAEGNLQVARAGNQEADLAAG